MTRNMYIAAVFAFATVLTQANQCTNGGAGCTGDSVPQNIVSMLQTNLKTNVLKGGGQEDNSNEQIAELMAQEKDAIASEDFVAAQNLKSEINALQSKAASSGVLDAGADVDGKKESLVGNMLMLNKPAAILTELEQKVTAGEVPAFDVISQIKTLVTDDIMPYLQDSRDQAIQQATELRALVTACNEDFKSSDAYPGSTMEQAVNTARSNHITCRDAQDTAHAFNLTQPDSYCVKLGELLHDTMPLSSPGASASPRATSVASVVSALHTMPSCNSDVLQLDANCTQQETELANKHQECSLKQETFEFRFCEWKDGLESKCKTLDSCYSTTSGLYNAHVAQMKTSLEKWDIENKTLHTILCYCNVWLRSTDSADNRSQHNASHFEACKVSTHPTEVVELVPTQKDDCMLGSVSNHPGTQAFTDQEYGSVTDFVAPVIPCIPDCGVNEKIVENVCVACPAGKTSPGRNSTICDATLCGTDEKVVGHICVKCAPGKMSMSNNDASGADTQCQATKCGANEKVVDHVCVQCPAGKIGSGDDDASGGNTQCEATTTTTTTTEASVPTPTWLEYTGDEKYTYTVAKTFCAHQGGTLCTKEQYCPQGEGQPLSELILGFPNGQTYGDKWAPYGDTENGWIQTGEGHIRCKDHTQHYGPPAWGKDGSGTYGSTMCCFMPQATTAAPTTAVPTTTQAPTPLPDATPAQSQSWRITCGITPGECSSAGARYWIVRYVAFFSDEACTQQLSIAKPISSGACCPFQGTFPPKAMDVDTSNLFWQASDSNAVSNGGGGLGNAWIGVTVDAPSTVRCVKYRNSGGGYSTDIIYLERLASGTVGDGVWQVENAGQALELTKPGSDVSVSTGGSQVQVTTSIQLASTPTPSSTPSPSASPTPSPTQAR